MASSSAVWTVATLSAVCVGLAGAVVMLPLLAIVVITVLGAGAALAVDSQTRNAPEGSGGTTVAAADGAVRDAAAMSGRLTPAALAGIGLTAFLGLTLMISAYTFLVVLILTVTSPPALTRLSTYRAGRTTTPSGRRPTTAHRTPASPVESYPTLDDEALCRAWRTSFPRLREADGTTEVQAAYAARAALLDEMERRNPAGFRRWIHSGARAAGDPLRYLTGPDS